MRIALVPLKPFNETGNQELVINLSSHQYISGAGRGFKSTVTGEAADLEALTFYQADSNGTVMR
jgi:hypothetical protein